MADTWEQAQRVIGLIDGRWTVALLVLLHDRGRRYQELDDALDGLSHKVLTETLRRAERDGLIERHLDPGRVETATLYELTDLGRSIYPLVAALQAWANDNWPDVEQARQHWNQRGE